MTQVRQRTGHKKTFFYLEQLLIKHRANSKCTNIKAVSDGLDFFFDKKDDARKLVIFLENVIPCRYVPSERLISHDTHSNTYNYKYTYSVEIVPVCKGDIVCLPLALARSLGNINQLCICLRITKQVYLIDPTTLKTAEINANVYWRQPFKSIANCKQLTEYTVMNIELVGDTTSTPFGHHSDKHVLADVWVVKSSDLGNSDEEIHVKTHLGHLLSPGDTVMGFDLKNANVNEPNFEKMQEKDKGKIPDVILVRKVFGDKMARNRKRQWKLRRLNVEAVSEGSTANRDFNDFMEDLEEDPISRANVNIYKDSDKMANMMAIDTDDVDDEALPQITLMEMLDDLAIDDDEKEQSDEDESM